MSKPFREFGNTGEIGGANATGVITHGQWHEIDAVGEIQFQNTWVHYDTSLYGPCRYRKTSSGLVVMQGLMKSGTISTTLPAFILPVGYRPSVRLLITTMSNSAISRMDIETNGNVLPYSGSNAWYSIACVFYAG